MLVHGRCGFIMRAVEQLLFAQLNERGPADVLQVVAAVVVVVSTSERIARVSGPRQHR
jgi:hypothetical protein